MSRIVICSSSKNNIVGGVERFCYLLKDVLEKENYEVQIIGKEDLASNFFYKIFSKIKGLDLIFLGYFLGKLADKLNPDLVITNGLYGFSAKSVSLNIQHGTFAKASDRIDKIFLKKIIRKYVWGFFEKMAVKKAKKVVVVSKETKESVKKYYGRDDVSVILNAVDINLFSPKDKIESREIFNLPQDKKFVLFVGRLSREKSPEIIYELAKKFEQEDIYLVLATDRILNWDLKNIIFLFNVEYQKLPYLYSACDVFILPSKHEGFAFTLIEAMSCKLPFVISRVGGAYEIYENIFESRNFIINEENLNSEYFYAKIKEILKMGNDQINEIKNKEKEFVLKNCSLSFFEKNYINLINKILKK